MAYHMKDENKINADHIRKVWFVDQENVERALSIMSQRCSRMDNPPLVRRYFTNDRC